MCAEWAVAFESISTCIRGCSSALGFCWMGMGAGRMAEQGQREMALCLFINQLQTELK